MNSILKSWPIFLNTNTSLLNYLFSKNTNHIKSRSLVRLIHSLNKNYNMEEPFFKKEFKVNPGFGKLKATGFANVIIKAACPEVSLLLNHLKLILCNKI